jgi:F-type H+-transporting ATPase subunit gamma
MESLQQLKTRKAAVANVGKITKAMEVVSATKMKKSQDVAKRTRPYAYAALDLLKTASRVSPFRTVHTETRKSGRTLLVLVASDRGLTGAFNANVLRHADTTISELSASPLVITVGKKASAYALKNSLEIAGEYEGFGDFVEYSETLPLSDAILREFESNKDIASVVTLSMHFRTTLKQEVLRREILPTNALKIEETINNILPENLTNENPISSVHSGEYIIEPSAEILAKTLIPYLIRMQIFHLILEANASEHSARMVAMKTATDNADELASDLTLSFNKARQESITNELIEITSTQNAL